MLFSITTSIAQASVPKHGYSWYDVFLILVCARLGDLAMAPKKKKSTLFSDFAPLVNMGTADAWHATLQSDCRFPLAHRAVRCDSVLRPWGAVIAF